MHGEDDIAAENFIETQTKQDIKDAISEELEEQGYTKEQIEELSENGYERIQGDSARITEEKPHQFPEGAKGSEGTPKSHNYPEKTERKSQNSPLPKGKNTAEITKRQRLGAMKAGIETFLEKDAERVSHDPGLIKHRQEMRERRLEAIEEIEQILEELPPDEPEKDDFEIEDISDEEARKRGYENKEERGKSLKEGREEYWARREFNKQSKMNHIETIYSLGICHKGLLGFEAIGALSQEQDNLIKLTNLPLSLWPKKSKETNADNEDTDYDYDYEPLL